jgi:Flp pilus assembly protein TadG
MRTSGRRGFLRFGRDERGATAVEFAMVAPFLIALFFGIFEFGRALWIQGILDYAVEQAARCEAINTTTCSSASATETFAGGLSAPLPYASSCPVGQICPVYTATAPACGYKVSGTYAFNFLSIGSLPILGASPLPTTVTLTSQSCYPT